MSNISIPSALDPHGNTVPIEEAAKHKLDYYKCPECGEFVNPRKGPKRQYFAHKQGVLENTACSLSSQADVGRMVEDLRTSDIEKKEQERSIRVHIGEVYESHLDCFGVIPSLEWNRLPDDIAVGDHLPELEIQTSGVENPPVPQNFHPRESEVTFNLDPTADQFRVSVTGPDTLADILGDWTADGLADGDLFLGDQARARRHRSNRQVRQGEWVYLTTNFSPPFLPELVDTMEIGEFDVLAFPARESTEQVLEKYSEGLTTDDYGFDADVILPASVHPTIEAPLAGEPGEKVLVGVIPSPEIDPTFEVVSIPKQQGDITDISPTGPGNPRFWTTTVQDSESSRISIHQRNSNRHRMVHLYPEDRSPDDHTLPNFDSVGLRVHFQNGDSTELGPITGQQSVTIGSEFNPDALPSMIEYLGPDGLDIEVQATFISESDLGPNLTRTTQSLTTFLPELSHWVRQGCEHVEFIFDGIGSVELQFQQPSLAANPRSSVEVNPSG